MYEGARFWGTFIYFEVPKWQKDGTEDKSVFNLIISSIIANTSSSQRMLASTTFKEVDWRFERTGQTGYFLFDAYIPILMTILCWLPIIIFNCMPNQNKTVRKLRSITYTCLHRIH